VRYWPARSRHNDIVIVVPIEAGGLVGWVERWGRLVDILKPGPFESEADARRVIRESFGR
jgi:hypothetical protein